MRLRVFFFLALTFLLIHMTTQASTPLSVCGWVGEDSTPFFTNCVSKNFQKIDRALGLKLKSCGSFNPRVDYGYQLCVKNNFKKIDERLRQNLKICSLFSEEVNVGYVACVQRNFKAIERVLP